MTAREILGFVLCLSLLAPLAARGEVLEVPSRDDWFGQDKALHFGVSAALAGAGYAGGALLFEEPRARWLTGSGVALGAGVAKELYDAGRGSFFSVKDLTWDVLGTATGLALSWTVDRLFFQRQDSARTLALQRSSLAFSLNAGGHPQGVPGNGRNMPVMLFLSGGW